MIEEKNRTARSGFMNSGTRNTTLNTSRSSFIPNHNFSPTPPSSLPQIGQPPTTTNIYPRKPGFDKHLTEAQIRDKRAKGLCYKCDDKWNKNHQCKIQVNVILLDEDEVPGEEEDGTKEEEKVEEQVAVDVHEIDERIEVSLNSIAGLSSPKTMKIEGGIGKQPVVTLIDPGATHNFLSLKLVQLLGLPVTDTKPYWVRLGSGEAKPGRGICRGVELQLPGVKIVENFLLLGIGSYDVILGIQWLETLGNVLTNWKSKTMAYQWGSQKVVLQGNPALGRTLISLKAMERSVKHAHGGMMVEIYQSEGEAAENTKMVPEFLQETLNQYQEILKNQKGFPLRETRNTKSNL